MKRLLLDAGNSRIKWALVGAPGQDPPRGSCPLMPTAWRHWAGVFRTIPVRNRFT